MVLTFFFTCIAVFLISCYCGNSLDLYEGDNCTLKDGSPGTCKFVTQCPAAVQALQMKIFPQICGFEGKQSIVCCADINGTASGTTANVTTTTEKTASSRTPGDISKQKCKEYARYAYDTIYVPTLTLNQKTLYEYILDCAYQRVELIVGRTLARTKEFPHMAQIGYTDNVDVLWACGGSLISENFVLTARHCLTNPTGVAAFVRVGLTNQSDFEHVQQREVSERIGYPTHGKSRYYHDIGLLRLAKKVELNTFVRPACLRTERNIPDKKGIATGWGVIEFGGMPSMDLLKVVVEFYDVDACNKAYRREINRSRHLKEGIVDDWMICAGADLGLRDTCQGDSGGPLQIYHPESEEIKCMYDIFGIVSFGKSCGLVHGVPGVYTRISNYIKWIEDNVWPD